MITQLAFKVAELSFQSIVCIWYAKFNVIVPSPQVRHVSFKAQISATQSAMNIACFACFGFNTAFFQEDRSLIYPLLKHANKTLFIGMAKPFNHTQKFNGSLQYRTLS
jgi:hypothetical protein